MTSGADDALAAHELDLVTRASRGDDAAFDRFFERNAPSVQLLIERLLGPGPTADAVVVEAFEKTVRRLPLLGARNSSAALYVLSTARNGAYAALGKQRPSADGGPLGALLALPSRQRELLALRELGLPEEQCAEVAGIEPSEVGVQVARARLRLTDELEGLSLSTVFADDRAERLLAAEVVRAEGSPLPAGVEEEITRHADEDSRFAAALSAVRSPSRSVGQLPAATGASRLVTAARSGSVGAGRPGGVAAGGSASAFAASAAAAASSAADAADAAPPSGVPRATSDPYDEQIGDELAWGIIDEDDEPAPAAESSAPTVDVPSDGQWGDGAGSVSMEPPSPAEPGATHPPIPPPALPDGGGHGDSSLHDPFGGWDDDHLDWADDEKQWAAGPSSDADSPVHEAAAAAPVPASSAPDMAPGPLAGEPDDSSGAMVGEPTSAFDAVAAGLADPDPYPLPAERDPDLLELEPYRRSRWRWLIWVVAFALLFIGFVFAALTIVNAQSNPSLPPQSTLDSTTPKKKKVATTPKASPTKAKKRTTSSELIVKKTTPRTTFSASPGTASSGPSSSTSTASTGAGPTGTGTSSGIAKKKKKKTTTTAATPANDGEVVSGESSSGGSVRGTTP